MKKKIPLAKQIFIALILGVVVGLFMQNHAEFAEENIRPIGTIFLNLVKFIIGPIVLFSIMSGVVSMRDMRKVGQISGITVVYFFLTTAIATIIGLAVADIFRRGFPILDTSILTYEEPEAASLMDFLISIFPSNFLLPITEANMLQIIVMALMIGFAVLLIGEKANAAIDGINLWNEIFMKCMEMIMSFSPVGVFCLLCPVVAANGASIVGSLAKVILAAYAAYLLHALVVYSLTVRTFGGLNPITFFKEMIPAIMFSFSSASSIGSLPISMECTQKLGVSYEIASFVLPLGATINMDGTAIFQGVSAVFIASCYGINLSMAQIATIVLTATLASIGTAGVPGAGIVMLAMVLTSVGLPVEGIALVIGVDRIFDMGRTTLNILGDASCAVIVSNLVDKKKYL